MREKILVLLITRLLDDIIFQRHPTHGVNLSRMFIDKRVVERELFPEIATAESSLVFSSTILGVRRFSSASAIAA